MTIGSKGKVVEVKDNRALVEIAGRQKTFSIREDVNIKKGDKVVVILNTIIGKA